MKSCAELMNMTESKRRQYVLTLYDNQKTQLVNQALNALEGALQYLCLKNGWTPESLADFFKEYE